MAVDSEITRNILREELNLLKDLAQTYKWGIIPNFEGLSVLATMYSHNNDLFIIELQCSDYKEKPPFVEFIDSETGQPGIPHAYPTSFDSLFHSSGPCICAPFNQKAYKSVVATGPHEDWNFGDWMTSKANSYDWSNHSNIGGILLLIQTRILRTDYKGRMG